MEALLLGLARHAERHRRSRPGGDRRGLGTSSVLWRVRMVRMRDVPISDDMIRLGQFLKLADLVSVGSDARPLLASGAVRVNGETELRRGRQLLRGDIVELHQAKVRVA